MADIDDVREEGIDNEVLIEEIEKRAALYNKGLKEYSDVLLKKRLWLEVCERVFPDTWERLREQQKIIAVTEVQSRWKNIRACFTRELRIKKSRASGQTAAVKRRTYLYFDLLLFLIPHTRPTDSSRPVQDHEEEEEEIECQVTPTAEMVSSRTRKRHKRCYQESLPQISKDEKEREVDQDTHFALSLVPMLKKLSADDKLDVQIQILQVFKSIRKRPSPPPSPTGTTFRSPVKKFKKFIKS